jgi:pilus assembly protein Flp/PilA
MNTITTAVRNFMDDENGVTAIEYGLIAALIAAALVGGVGMVTGGLSKAFSTIEGVLRNPGGTPAA